MRRRIPWAKATPASVVLVGSLVSGFHLALPSPVAAAAGCTSTTPSMLAQTTCSTAGTDAVTVPNGAVYVSYTVIGGGAGGATSFVKYGTPSGSGAAITGAAQLPPNTASIKVMVGAGGAQGSNVGSSYSDGGRGGEGSGIFAVDGSSNVLADLVVAGGGGGAGSLTFGSNYSGDFAGGDAGLPGAAAQPGAGTVSGTGGYNTTGNPGQGANGATPGTGGTGSGPNGSANGATGGAQVDGTVAAGAQRALVPYSGNWPIPGGGGGGYAGGGAGGGGVNGGAFIGAAGGGGSSYVNPTYDTGYSAAVVGSDGPGFRGASGLTYYYTLSPTAGKTGIVKLTFSVAAPPTVTSVTPSSGTTAGGEQVTVNGTGFVNGATVMIGGNAATNVTYVSATQLTATTPAGTAGAKDVVVTNPDTQSGTGLGVYTYAAPPTVTAVSPSSGPEAGGTSVTITGTGFVNGATVKIGGNSASNVTFNSATSLSVTTPQGIAGTRNVVVTNPNNLSGTGTDLFTYVAAPTVTSISPTGGALSGGTPVTITGTGFASGATVTIGGSAATNVTFNGATELTATTPVGTAGLANVVVTNPDTQSGTGSGLYTYAEAPTVTNIDPSSGTISGGTPVTITGTGFVDGATVDIGGNPAADVSVVSDTSLTAKTPVGSAGPADVMVTNPDTQSGTGVELFTYIAAPEVSAIAPATGTSAGGTRVTITGTGFVEGAAVTVGGKAAKDVTFVNATSLTATTPVGIVGPADVVVTNPDSRSGTGPGLYTYTATGPSSPQRLDEVPLGSNPNLPASGLARGASLLLVDGQPSPVTVKPDAAANPTGLVYSAPGLNMRLAGRGDQDDLLGLTPKQALILQSEPAAQSQASSESGVRAKVKVKPTALTSGDGFAPVTPVKLYLLTVGYLGTVTTDTSGAFDGSVPVPAGIQPGSYTLQANGFAPDYSVRSLSIGVVVTSTAKVKQKPVKPLNLPKSVKDSGATTLLKAPVRTNAGQIARVSVRCTSSGNSQAAGELRLCTVTRKAGAVTVRTFGNPVKIRVVITADAVPGYTAYRAVKRYQT